MPSETSAVENEEARMMQPVWDQRSITLNFSHALSLMVVE